MSSQIDPADAAHALGEIGRRREQVIRRNVFPGWFWWANAVLTVVLAAAVDSDRGVLVWLGIALFTVGSLVINVPVSRAARAAPLRRGLVGPEVRRRSLVGLVTFVVVLFGAAAVAAFGLHAAGVPYPGTIAAAVAAVLFAVAGPILVRWEQTMIVRRSGSQR